VETPDHPWYIDHGTHEATSLLTDNELRFLKYLGATIMVFYGMLATVSDFKEKTHGKTKLPRAGLLGLSVLFLGSFLNLMSDWQKDKNDAIKADAAKAQALSQLALEASVREGVNANLAKAAELSTSLSETKKTLIDTSRVLGSTADKTSAILRHTIRANKSLEETSIAMQTTSQKTEALLYQTARINDPFIITSIFIDTWMLV
jgi:uncharacterized membrane protein YeiB